MLISLYLLITNIILPQIINYTYALLEPVMIIVIILAGIVMLFGVVGMKVSHNLGATIVGAIFKAIGYIAKIVVQAIGWIIRSIVKFIPGIFNSSRKTFINMGLNTIFSNILATIVATIVLVIII